MPWKRMLACLIGSVNADLLRRIEYLLEENRVPRNQIDYRSPPAGPPRPSGQEVACIIATHRSPPDPFSWT